MATRTRSTAIDVPAPTAWPLVLALGFTLMFAGLLTNVSVTVLGVVLVVAGCVGWFREVVPGEHEEEVPVVAEDAEVTTERRVVDRLADRARTGARLASRPHLSDLGGCEGRMGRQRRDGGAGLWLRSAESWQHLVSDQSACGGGLRAVGEARTCGAQCVSSRQLRDRRGRARPRLHARGTALRRDAADVPAAADRPRRTDRPGAVVGPAASDR